jgi:nucleoside-diphosphate-sugar epimerase
VKRVLVTGATGFIGRHATPLLEERGYEVHALGSRDVDLLDPAAARSLVAEIRPSHLLHLAWYAVPGKFWTSPENAGWVEASIRLLRAFAEQGGTRAVTSGSCAEYEWSRDVFVEDETPIRPATYYGVCKGALASVGAGLADELGFGFAWGRIFFVYGPFEPPGRLVSDVARALVNGEPAATSEGSQRRDFLHVRDVAGAFVSLLDSSVVGPVNVGSGTAVAVRDVVAEIAAAAGRPELVRWGAVSPPPGDPPVIEADVTRLRKDVGWRPAVSLADGIRETVEWWKANT